MNILSFIIILVVIGLVLWLINSFIPMDAKIKQILNIAVVIFVVIWLIVILLRVAGIETGELTI